MREAISGTYETEIGYTGHHYHIGSGLVLTLYRAYDSVTGRWLSTDPLGEGSNVQGNLYNYVGNNPINYWDPLGLQGAPLPLPEIPSNIPNGPWRWVPDQQNSRGGTNRPVNPPVGQSQPTLTWSNPTNNSAEGNRYGYWKYNDGKGGTQRYDRTGCKITPSQAHPGRPGGRAKPGFGRAKPGSGALHPLAIIGAIIIQAGLDGGWIIPGESRSFEEKMSCGDASYCFAGETLISIPNGLKRIDLITKGDKVISYSHLSQVTEISSVIKTHSYVSSGYFEVKVGNSVLKVTGEHPFYCDSSQSYVPIKDVKVGENFRTKTGELVSLNAKKWIEKEMIVYNITVQGNNNYYVTSMSILVHNK